MIRDFLFGDSGRKREMFHVKHRKILPSSHRARLRTKLAHELLEPVETLHDILH